MKSGSIIEVPLSEVLPSHEWWSEESIDYTLGRLEHRMAINPIVVRPVLIEVGGLEPEFYWRIIDGHHRVEAHRRMGLGTIRARVSL